MEKRWNILKPVEAVVTALHQSLKISPAICSILAKREIDSFEKAKAYFRPQLSDLHDPWLMKDMDKAVNRITAAF